jgi:ATP-binding cassette subfamily C protein
MAGGAESSGRPAGAVIAALRHLFGVAMAGGRLRLAGLIGLGAAAGLAEGAGFLLLGAVLERLGLTTPAAPGQTLPSLEAALAIYLCLVIVAALTIRARSVIVGRLKLETVDRLRHRLLQGVLRMEWPALHRLQTPPTTQLLTTEVVRVGLGLELMMQTIAIVIRLPVLIAVAFMLSPLFAGVGVVVALALAAAALWLDRSIRCSGETILAASRALHTAIAESLYGRRLVKTLGLESRQLRHLDDVSATSRDAQLDQQRILANSRACLTIAIAVLTAFSLVVAVRGFGIGLTEALVIVLTFARLGQSVLRIRDAWQVVALALPAEAAIRQQIAGSHAHAEAVTGSALPMPARAILLESVSLAHDEGTVALHEISVSIPVGRITAVAGPSGAGKSTLADIVMGLLPPGNGRITLDGQPLTAASRRWWRTQVGYVPQDAFLFDDTIRSNLLVANPDAREDALWAALDEADGAAFVRALPQGLDTPAGERGTRLSGGERQRIALARALLRRPQLLVLDEPTSALDNDSEARIAQTLQRLKGRLTILVVAHRPALLAIADQVITLENGQVRQTRQADEP